MNYCHVAGRFSGRGCVICTGGCSIVRWINHLALIAAKLFEMYETHSLRLVCALTLVSSERPFCFAAGSERERERERDLKPSKTIYIRQNEPSRIPSLNLLFVWHSDLLGPLFFSFSSLARLSGMRRKKRKIQGMNIYQPLAGISCGNSYVSQLFCWIT